MPDKGLKNPDHITMTRALQIEKKIRAKSYQASNLDCSINL